MEPPILIIYHADCVDGFTAAWVLARHFGLDETSLFAARYHAPPPPPERVAGHQVYVVDFCYSYDVMVSLSRASGKTLVLLDHHKTSAEVASRLFDEGHALGTHDLAHSGARLAWDWTGRVWDWTGRVSGRPLLIDYVEDRDLWHNTLLNSDNVALAIQGYPMWLETWDRLAATPISELAEAGEAIRNWQVERLFKPLLDGAEIVVLDGIALHAVNAPPWVASDVLHRLLQSRPNDTHAAAAFWYDVRSRVWHVSLRSDDTRPDVSEIARTHGGGGHRNAAGFTSRRFPFGGCAL